MIHPGFIRREIVRSSKQAMVFILCVGLSLVTLTAFSGFSKSIHQSLLHDARKLHAADIIIRSYETLSDPLSEVISEKVQEGRAELARYHEFYSVIRTNDDRASVLSLLKVVEKGYPFYGEVVLKSGRPLHEVLTSGQTVVAPTLLDRLGESMHQILGGLREIPLKMAAESRVVIEDQEQWTTGLRVADLDADETVDALDNCVDLANLHEDFGAVAPAGFDDPAVVRSDDQP